MSIQTLRLRPKLSVSNTIAVENVANLDVSVRKGPKNILGKENSPSSYSANGLTFTFFPNSGSTFVDRDIYLRQKFRCVINGTGSATTGNIIDPGVWSALRSFPLHRVISNLTIAINGTAESISPNNVIPAFERYSDSNEFLTENCSMTPTMPDKLQQYADSYLGSDSVRGIVQDSLSGFGNTDKLQGGGRGQFGFGNGITIVAGNNSPGALIPGSVTVDIELTESLIHPFLKAFHPNSTALVGIRQLDFTITYLNDLFKFMWSQSDHPNAGVITSSSVSVVDAPSFGIITYDSAWPVPPVVLYTFPKIVQQSQNVGELTPGQVVTVNYNSFQLGTEPDNQYLFVRENDNNVTVTSTNTFAAIQNVNVTYDNVNNILSSLAPTQIWKIHTKNGGLLSKTEFEKLTGGVLKLEWTKDIPIPSLDSAPGMMINKNIQNQITIKNISSRNITYTAWILVIYKGVLQINTVNMTAETKTTILSPEDVYSAGNDIANADVTDKSSGWFGGKAAPQPSNEFVPYESMIKGAGLISKSRELPQKNGLFGGMAINKNVDLQRRY